MQYILVFVALFAASLAHAQYTPIVTVKWAAVTEQEDGTVIDSSDVSYVVYDAETAIPVCATQSLECNIDIAWDECISLYATAKQASTALESSPSNTVEACSGARPDFPLRSPVITISITVGIETLAP